MNVIKFEDKEPKIAQGVKIFPNASVIGDVEIGEDSSVWFGSAIRGDIESVKIGKRTNIQDLVVIHTYQKNAIAPNGFKVVVGDDVTISHRAILHGCKIGSRCLVGMGSIISDSVEVGEDCFITANSFLPKGKKYPPLSLISGNPAKVVRPLRSEEMEAIKKESELYLDLKNRYNF